MSTQDIKAAFDKLTLPISVVTVGHGGDENGLTVSWFMPVSFDPPQIAISLDARHLSIEYLESTKNFVLNLLGDDQAKLAGRFASQSFEDKDKLDGVEVRSADSGSAIITDALAWFDCEVVAIHDAGDHKIFVGQVTDAGIQREGSMLTTGSGLRYRKGQAQ